ncbi:MAG: Co2+/Mg2+ efflux protein ApaG [Saprospiraceae bacterium]
MDQKSKIYSSVTDDICISVVPRYEAEESNPAIGKFIYSYHITIENLSKDPVKLLSRHWHIIDSIQLRREVVGDGVIGQQPELRPGDTFQYMSWSPLHSPIGKMFGTFTFINLRSKITFEVDIPEFILVSDFKLN